MLEMFLQIYRGMQLSNSMENLSLGIPIPFIIRIVYIQFTILYSL